MRSYLEPHSFSASLAPWGPMLCPCVLVQGGRAAEHDQGDVGAIVVLIISPPHQVSSPSKQSSGVGASAVVVQGVGGAAEHAQGTAGAVFL